MPSKSSSKNKLLAGKKILITAGPTREAIDPVRFISNCSSGRMGYDIARAARAMGGQVSLISGPTTINPPHGIKVTHVTTARQMLKQCLKIFPKTDITLMVAAVADYRPALPRKNKLKKGPDTLTLKLIKNPDILARLGKLKKSHQILVGFAAETEHLRANAVKKLKDKNLDFIALNDVGQKDIGFESLDNAITLIARDLTTSHLTKKPKILIARQILQILCQ